MKLLFSMLRLSTTPQNIVVHGLEFLGPISGDSTYEVDFCHTTRTSTASGWRGVKTIYAEEKKNFYLKLDPPVNVGPNYYEYFHYKIKVE